MKIFCHVPRENWIVDRMGIEYKTHSVHDVSFDKIENDTDVIWLLASWCWNQIPFEMLKMKKVVCTIHHEVPEKFDEDRKRNFLLRDTIVDHYLTYTVETKGLIESLSKKPVTIIPHWINTQLWKKLDKEKCRKDLKLPKDKFIIGSFQRDTEGHDLKSPKLEKGPDIFIEKILEISKFKDIHVLLGGWRRQYVIKKLQENKISFTYIELADLETVNKMYNSLDLYLISSRCEGGPQSLFESAYLEIPVLSTKSGQFNYLDENVLYDYDELITKEKLISAIQKVDQNYKNVKNLVDFKCIKRYDDFFRKEINEKNTNKRKT